MAISEARMGVNAVLCPLGTISESELKSNVACSLLPSLMVEKNS